MIPVTPKLNKIIEAKQVFADLAYQEYRVSRYGMTFCCPKDFNNHTTFNEICNWENNSQTLYTENEYTFTTWDWEDWMENENNPPPNWTITENTFYSTTRRFGMDVINATAPSSANDYVVTIGDYGLDVMRAGTNSWTGTYIYALIMRDIDGLPELANTEWNNLVNSQCSISSANTDGDSPSSENIANVDLYSYRGSSIDSLNYFNKARFMCINPGGSVIPANGDLVLNLRMNTNPVGTPKNGAKVGDYIWLVHQMSTLSNFTNANRVPQGTRRYNVNTGIYDNSGNDPYYDDLWSLTLVRNAPSGFPPMPGGTDRFTNGSVTAADDRCDFIAGGSTDVWDDNVGPLGLMMYWNAKESRYLQKFANTSIDAYDTSQPGYNICNDDAELLLISVKDKDGNPVQNYNIIIDNALYGKTDASGNFRVTLKNASVDTKHMINGCKCFTTTGGCNQQKIDIVLAESTKPSCTNLAIDCL